MDHRASAVARVLFGVALCVAAPGGAAAQLNPPPGPNLIMQTFEYRGCDGSGATLRSCTQLQVEYSFGWDPFRNGYIGGVWNRGVSFFFDAGTVDCVRTGVPRGGVSPCVGPITGNFFPRVGQVGFQLGGCNDLCIFRDGVPDPFAMAPQEITFAVAYGPENVFYDARLDLPAGFTRSTYVLSRVQTTTAPEPATLALTGSGLLALGVVARRRASRRG